MTDTGIRLCFCPPMDDPNDPDQHTAGCLHQMAILTQRFLDDNDLIPVAGMLLKRDHAFPFRTQHPRYRPSPPAIPDACYKASFGWVHVRPGCRCVR